MYYSSAIAAARFLQRVAVICDEEQWSMTIGHSPRWLPHTGKGHYCYTERQQRPVFATMLSMSYFCTTSEVHCL